MPKHFVVAGASGLVGSDALRQLALYTDTRVIALVRKPGLLNQLGIKVSHITERMFDYDNPDHINQLGTPALPCDVFLCCLGSTIKAAGSQEAFRRIEHDYPVACLNALKQNAPQCVYALVSSLGASPNGGFYLKNKFTVESAVRESGLCFVIARPSLLLGNRTEFRLGERIATVGMTILYAILRPLGLMRLKILANAHPIETEQVAHALVHYSLRHKSVLLEGNDLRELL